MISIQEISLADEKSHVCDVLLHALPDWFGIETSIAEYVQQVRSLPFFAAMEGEQTVGFVALTPHNAYTAELCVMGILCPYHRQGIGRMLVYRCERYAAEHAMEFLTVKTLDASRPDDGYEKTRRFYHAMGFRPLEVFPALWDLSNPCLFMAKYVGVAGTPKNL